MNECVFEHYMILRVIDIDPDFCKGFSQNITVGEAGGGRDGLEGGALLHERFDLRVEGCNFLLTMRRGRDVREVRTSEGGGHNLRVGLPDFHGCCGADGR